VVPTDDVADEAARAILDDEPERHVDSRITGRPPGGRELVEDVALVGHAVSSVTRELRRVR
jgi:hypothetical protein